MENNILVKYLYSGMIKIFDALNECEKCKAQVWKYSFGREF